MFERFTDRARRAVVFAQDEARALDHDYIGTEHILLGLIREGEGVAATALDELGISLSDVRARIEEIIGRGRQAPSGHIPFTPRSKKVIEMSLRESLQLGHSYIGTEHLLLGLIREGEGVAAQVLDQLGAELHRVRQQVMQVVERHPELRGFAEKAPRARPTSTAASRVFLCYRAEDSAWVAGRVYDELVRQLGADHVFMDVDSIEPGHDFLEASMAALSSCELVLVLVGAQWLTAPAPDGRRRLDLPDDYVRVELEAALRLGKRMVLVLVEDTTMPRADELPPNIAELVSLRAIRLEHRGFHEHMRHLLRMIAPGYGPGSRGYGGEPSEQA